MGYMIQAIVGRADILRGVADGFPQAQLAQGILLVPLKERVRQAYEIPFGLLTDEIHPAKPIASTAALCSRLSQHGKVAYVEAALFGDTPMQAAILAVSGSILGEPIVSLEAINEALRFLGVTKGTHDDEFAAVGLHAKHDTEEW
jgi:hypothetical protein